MTTINRSRLRKAIALILPLIFIFIFAQQFLFNDRNYDTERLEQFYREEKDSLDVIFVGASEVSHGYNPGYAYDQYGFTSYCYSLDANQGSLYLSQLKEILKHQNPGILFVDLSGFLGEEVDFFNSIIMHNYLRGIPFSKNKIQTILEYPNEETVCFFFPLIMYHGHVEIAYEQLLGTYDQLTRETHPADLKGILSMPWVDTEDGYEGIAFDPLTYKLADSTEACLIELLEYCKQNNLHNIVFTNFPRKFAVENNNMMFLCRQAESIIQQYGYPVLNLQDDIDLVGIDAARDFADMYHLNIHGQLKITDYFGNKVINEYGLSPRAQSNANRLAWEVCASNTQEYINTTLETITAKYG